MKNATSQQGGYVSNCSDCDETFIHEHEMENPRCPKCLDLPKEGGMINTICPRCQYDNSGPDFMLYSSAERDYWNCEKCNLEVVTRLEDTDCMGLEPSCTDCGKSGVTLIYVNSNPIKLLCENCRGKQFPEIPHVSKKGIEFVIPIEEGAMSRQDRKTIGNHARVVAEHSKAILKLGDTIQGVGLKLQRLIELAEKEIKK